jgi:hypothetical protein
MRNGAVMVRRSRGHVSHIGRERLLAALRGARQEGTSALAVCPIGSPEYAAVGQLLDSIDDVAEVIAGDRKLFWPEPSRTSK